MVEDKLSVGTGGLGLFLFFRQGRHLNHLHRLGAEQVFEQLIEPAGRQLLAQGCEQDVGVEEQCRVAGMQPAGGRIDGIQHAIRQTARTLQRCKLCRVQRSQQQFFRDALGQNVVRRFPHTCGKLCGRFFRRAAQDKFQRRLQGAVIKADIDICAQLLFQQSGFHRRLVVAQQGVQQNFHAQLTLPVGKCAGIPCQRALHFVWLRLFGVVRNFHRDALLLVL